MMKTLLFNKYLKLSFLTAFLFIHWNHIQAQDNSWKWQHPFPVGNSHFDVAWISEETFYVSGTKGQFIKTSDFGGSWEVSHLPTEATVREIDFINESKGWAVTDNGQIWVTEDAGTNWTLQYENAESPTLRDIYFYNEQIGYAVGDAGYVENVLFKTENGGEDWSKITLPLTAGASFYGLFFCKAVSQDTVYAAGWDNTFFRSYDGGTTWNTISLPATAGGFYEGAYFVNESTGFIVGPSGYIIKTTDSGATWSVLMGSAESSDYFTEAYFYDNMRGWVSSFECLYTTEDGGATWSSNCESDYGGSRKSFIQFDTEGNGIAVASYDILVTHNGNDFEKVLPIDSINDLYSISNANDHLYIAASAGEIFHSTDKGQQWQVMSTPVNSALHCVQFVDDNHGWAAGNDGIVLKTEDGGNNWQQVEVGYEGNFSDMYLWSREELILTGATGTIIKTSDAGANWSVGNISAEDNLNAVHFVSADTGYVVGNTGLLAMSTDGGYNWELQDPGVLSHLNDVFFVSSSTGYAVGRSGIISYTENGGGLWIPQVSGVSATLNSVYFSDANHGYITTSGNVLATDDGGKNWNIQPTPSGNTLLDIYFNDQGQGWAVGTAGNILFYGEHITGVEDLGRGVTTLETVIYPNPAKSRIHFKLQTSYSGPAVLIVNSLNGNKVVNTNINFQDGEYLWDITPELENGVYVIQLRLAGEVQSSKLIINR
ncbi:YCF48-related protein [Fulvivirga maritima]|uniref:YCF48-related protein n=1 Tax=Fulvivirga maritima TaxID=2904247 RepID=UPI001F2302EA|nr:YCF48-related protein [Fulvivirga maritima]UII26784.1 YCF48-related protein [Fulvivirga maritima]